MGFGPAVCRAAGFGRGLASLGRLAHRPARLGLKNRWNISRVWMQYLVCRMQIGHGINGLASGILQAKMQVRASGSAGAAYKAHWFTRFNELTFFY